LKQKGRGTRLKINKRAFHEILLYYLRERITEKNINVKHLIVSNVYEWYIFDEKIFERIFARNRNLVKQFQDFELSKKPTEIFYTEIAEPFIAEIEYDIEFTYIDIREYEKPLRNQNSQDDNKLIALFKLLSPEHLLKLPFVNDSNSLDKRFYGELLHIIGLAEKKEGSKKIIERNAPGQRHTGTLLENAMIQLDSLDKISRLENARQFGATQSERLFNVALELGITWINRILFLKLLEAQLVAYHKGDKSYEFLNTEKVKDYDDLNSLFFQVLARRPHERNEDVKKAFEKVPYLNSSLFEPTEIEHATLFISQLRNDKPIPLYPQTVLKDETGKKRNGNMNPLAYLFAFLSAYDFASEGSEEIQEDNKTLINASVLGLIFEKINGYKDGSFFTPGFITMYMCRETIRKAVIQKFNETKGWNCTDMTALYNKIEDRNEANKIINDIKICDPAVGSGHFLVSALNELIAIKSDLNILLDRQGRWLKEYHLEVLNDELIVTDEDGQLFEYNPENKESQRVQETLFHEKQTLIENCLFGVDINANSVKICRLRLWIELLKNAYYKTSSSELVTPGHLLSKPGSSSDQVTSSHQVTRTQRTLETLPNIDINIKWGNSLISRFAIDADLGNALKSNKWTIDSYRVAVDTYRNAQSKEVKREMEKLIATIKSDFKSNIDQPFKKKIRNARAKVDKLATEINTQKQWGEKINKQLFKDLEKAAKNLKKLEEERDNTEANKIYEDAFEWRFEFPEVLDDNGNFTGFDVVIGNPPYFSMSKLKEQADYFSRAGFETYSKGADIYCLFYELGGRILKNEGFLTYITSNSWLRAIYGELLKTYFMKSLQPISLLNIEDIQVFEEATVESNIITLQKRKLTHSFAVVNLADDYKLGASLSEYFEFNHFEFAVPDTSEWFIGKQLEGNLKAKIETQGKQLKEFDIVINRGILTGYNTAFIIGEQKKDELIKLDERNAEIIKPILRGRDLKKYSYEFSKLWAICTFPSLKIDIEKHPSVKSYFLEVGKSRLEQSGEQGSRKKTNNKWFETQDSISYWEDFEKPKIIWGELSNKAKFTFDNNRHYLNNTVFMMVGEKLKYLLAILNSSTAQWYFETISTTSGMGTNRWLKYKIELLPIKEPSENQEKEIENLVDEILLLKNQNSAADTSDLENQINHLVYQLYGLTAEEIAIIENS